MKRQHGDGGGWCIHCGQALIWIDITATSPEEEPCWAHKHETLMWIKRCCFGDTATPVPEGVISISDEKRLKREETEDGSLREEVSGMR